MSKFVSCLRFQAAFGIPKVCTPFRTLLRPACFWWWPSLWYWQARKMVFSEGQPLSWKILVCQHHQPLRHLASCAAFVQTSSLGPGDVITSV